MLKEKLKKINKKGALKNIVFAAICFAAAVGTLCGGIFKQVQAKKIRQSIEERQEYRVYCDAYDDNYKNLYNAGFITEVDYVVKLLNYNKFDAFCEHNSQDQTIKAYKSNSSQSTKLFCGSVAAAAIGVFGSLKAHNRRKKNLDKEQEISS